MFFRPIVDFIVTIALTITKLNLYNFVDYLEVPMEDSLRITLVLFHY